MLGEVGILRLYRLAIMVSQPALEFGPHRVHANGREESGKV